MLDRAIDAYEKYNSINQTDSRDEVALSDKKPYDHGVTYNEYSKLGAILYMYTGNKKYLDASKRAYRKIDRYFMLASGLHCSNEHIRSNHYMQSHEACDISDYTWSLGYLLMATGDASYADKIEKCVLNAGIGQATEDFRAVQYFSCPNQVIADKSSNHNLYFRGSDWMQFRPNHTVQCCPGNITRFFPNYCLRIWMNGSDNSVYSVFFGESVFNSEFNGTSVSEHTEYPFGDTVNYEVTSCRKPFDLFVRIPNWCKSPTVKVNGEEICFDAVKGFARIDNVKKGDKVSLKLPSEIKVAKYGQNGLVISKGPLVYSLGMYGRRETEKVEDFPEDYPVYNIYADKDWNYCLLSDDAKNYKFEERKTTGNPWNIKTTPYIIKTKAFKVDGWELKHCKESGEEYPENNSSTIKRIKKECTFTPKLPSRKLIEKSQNNEKTEIELVPLATAKLRITVFPKV